MVVRDFKTKELEGQAAEVATILRALANERRLMILCKLVEWGEASVNALAGAVGLSQPALSQHLARMRREGLVTYRRESQTLRYRIADPRLGQLFETLHGLFCTIKPRPMAANAQETPHVPSRDFRRSRQTAVGPGRRADRHS
jgi:ArsR family transcriptional regulator